MGIPSPACRLLDCSFEEARQKIEELHLLRRTLVVLALGLMAGPWVKPFSESNSAWADSPQDKACREVFQRLLPYVETPTGVGWPPELTVDDSKEVNAYAYIDINTNSAQVRVCRGYLEHYKSDLESALVFSLGHELSHLSLGHCLPKPQSDPVLLRHAFTRNQELEADSRGVQVALRAGYRFRDISAHLKKLALEDESYDRYLGAGVDHPSWTDRVAALDKGQSQIWLSKSSFDSGVTLLATMQYQRAAECFQEVVEDFPDCHEAWTNLSHSYLMAYVDTLNVDYLKRYNLGMLMYCDVYPSPRSLHMRLRAFPGEFHSRAVEAARKSLEVQPKQVLAWTNLGVANLVAPGGPRLAEAEKCFQKAFEQVEADAGLTDRHVVSVLNNLACVFLAEGKEKNARKSLEMARKVNAKRKNRLDQSILDYNLALLDLNSRNAEAKRKAIEGMQSFLKVYSGQTVWAERARELLAQNHAPSTVAVQKKLDYRPISQVGEVCLLQSSDEVRALLGAGEETPCGPGVVRLRYAQRGLELYLQEGVFAIALFSPQAPAVQVRPQGLGSKAWQFRVGDDIESVTKRLADQATTRQTMIRPGQYFTTYGDMGLSVREEKGKVAEILVTAPTY